MSCCPGPYGVPSRTASRRQFLRRAGAGFGMVALASLLQRERAMAATVSVFARKARHFRPRAERVIFLFMSGGPSHVDLFDPKPDLTRLHGEKLPAAFGPVKNPRRGR